MKTLIYNKSSKRDFEIFEKFTAGISLKGFEVKAIKNKKGSLKGSYIIIKNREAYLINSKIPPYQQENVPKNYDPQRQRKLLLNKKEILYLETKRKQGFVIIPIRFFLKGDLIKLELGLAKALKKHQKKQKLIERQVKRQIERELRTKY